MVTDARARIVKRKDGKYQIYMPQKLTDDSMFPFKDQKARFVKISFQPGSNTLLIEEW